MLEVSEKNHNFFDVTKLKCIINRLIRVLFKGSHFQELLKCEYANLEGYYNAPEEKYVSSSEINFNRGQFHARRAAKEFRISKKLNKNFSVFILIRINSLQMKALFDLIFNV